MTNRKFLEDFVKGTKIWLKEIRKQEAITNLEKGQCCMCGTNYDNMEKLAEIIKNILEKTI